MPLIRCTNVFYKGDYPVTESTLKKCKSLLFLLNRIKKYLNIPTRKLFYNAYILPHLDYCCSVRGNASTELMTSIIKFQKRAARSILDKPIETPSEELFAELKWITFPERVLYQKAILIYKIMHNLTPAYLTNMFTFSKEVHDRTLRSTADNLLYIPKPNIEHYRNSLACIIRIKNMELHSKPSQKCSLPSTI